MSIAIERRKMPSVLPLMVVTIWEPQAWGCEFVVTDWSFERIDHHVGPFATLTPPTPAGEQR